MKLSSPLILVVILEATLHLSTQTQLDPALQAQLWKVFQENFIKNLTSANLISPAAAQQTTSNPVLPSQKAESLVKFRSLVNKGKPAVVPAVVAVQSSASTNVPLFPAIILSPTTSAVPPTIQTVTPKTVPTFAEPAMKRPPLSRKECGIKVVGYLTPNGTTPITEQMLLHYTHVIIAFAEIGTNGSLWLNSNTTQRLRDVVSLRDQRVPQTKVLLAIGGAEKSAPFPILVRNEAMIQEFGRFLTEWIATYRLDGVDIDWEFPGKRQDDASLYVAFMKKVRGFLDQAAKRVGKERLLLTFAAPAVEERMIGFDIPALLDGSTIDWANIMTYDYHAPWNNTYGTIVGAAAPLFPRPNNSSRTTISPKNIHSTMEMYLCKTNQTAKLVIGVPFYGYHWGNVDFGAFRSEQVNGSVLGGFIKYSDDDSFRKAYNFTIEVNPATGSASGWDDRKRVFYSYETAATIDWKTQYVLQNNFGGIMVWSADYDDINLTLANAITNGSMCENKKVTSTRPRFSKECPELRWWTEPMDAQNAGKCGRDAPLLNGKIPVCNPNDPLYSCCGQWGYCGSGKDYCDCMTCVDYGKNPERVLLDNVVPTNRREKLWWTLEDGEDKAGRCGEKAPKINGKTPICDPFSKFPCCSEFGFCGGTMDHCLCPSCSDFRRQARRVDSEDESLKGNRILWYGPLSEPETIGRCGPDAIPIDGVVPICNPNNPLAHCCSKNGYCGTGAEYCECSVCTDFSKNPNFRFTKLF